MDTPMTDLDALERLLAYSKDLRHIREDREEAEHDLYEALPALIAAARRTERLEAALDNLLRHHNAGAGSHARGRFLPDCEFAKQARAALDEQP